MQYMDNATRGNIFFNARVRIGLMQLIRNTTIALTEFAIKFLPSVAQVLETV